MGENDRSSVGVGHPGLLGHLDGLLDDALLGGAAFVVEARELLGEVGGALSSCGGHELEGIAGVPEASDRVESWGESESDGFGVDLIGVESGGGDEGAESDDGCCFDSCEAELGDDAVLVNERDDVGDGSEGGEDEEIDEGGAERGGDGIRFAVEGRESPGEFVGDSGAAEFSEGVLRVWSSWVDDGEGAWHVVHLRGWVVVIGDDEVDAEVFGFDCGVDGGDAAVDGDDDLCSGLGECFDCGFVEAVAFIDAVGDVGGDLSVWCDDSEHVDEDGGGGDAVDIVISEDDDGFVVGDCFEDAIGGFVEVGDE